MLYVVQLDWQDKDGVSRLDTILEYALAGTPYKLISHLEEFIALCPDTPCVLRRTEKTGSCSLLSIWPVAA